MNSGAEPPLIHVTHAKAGSTWLYNIFHDVYPKRLAERVGGAIDQIDASPGDIHSAVFCDYEAFQTIRGAADSRCFFIMRDIRDTMISLYFSRRYSHVENVRIKGSREVLKEMSEDEGILHLFRTRSVRYCEIQSSWMGSGKPVYRYEDLFETQGDLLFDILEDVGFEYDRRRMKKALHKRSFEKQFKRKPGDVDIHSHGRSGLPGGWRDHLTPELEAFINEGLGEHLRLTGYEA